MKKKGWGFDTRDIDKRVRPQDDFFHYANGGWIKREKIPPHESRWGSFQILQTETQKKLREIVNGLLKAKHLMKGTAPQLVGDLYRSGMDMKARNALGAKPLERFRTKIKKLKTKEDVLRLVAKFHKLGIGVLWGAAIDQDAKNSETYLLHLYQDGLGVPERDYYLLNNPEQVRVRTAYLAHIERMLKLFGWAPQDARRNAAIIFAIEKTLATASMRKEDTRDPHKTYHKLSVKALQKLSPVVNWRSYLKAIGARTPTKILVMQPGFLKAVSSLLKQTSMEDWRVYLEWHLFIGTAGLLSQRFVQANFDFYGKVLSGAKKMRPLWRRALSTVNGTVGESLGQIYVEKYFTHEAKRKMDALISDLFAVYAERIKVLDWMSPATKKRAQKKLKTMVRKIGYPKRWKSYRRLVIDPADYFGNVMRASLHEHARQMHKLGKPVDREEWFMTPQTVNAYYNQGTNEIVFPAAILQHPFFDASADDAVNYGAIGAVIGHEITHGFDDQGSKFDEKGNLKSWWTSLDRARFEKKARVVERQFNQYELHGVKVNGKLTLGENIADLGGDAIAFAAYERHLKKTGRKIIDGFAPEQRFFLAKAQDWREIARPEHLKTSILTDPHSPDIFRVNGPLSNLTEFYEAFGVKKGDKLYRAPKARAKIW